MRVDKRLTLIAAALLLSILACTVGSNSPSVETQVAETVQAGRDATLTASAGSDSEAAPTDTPEAAQPAAETPTETQPGEPTATATDTTPMVSVSVNTNCRYGPGNVYEPPIGALLTGEEAEIVGVPISPMDYIIIDNPDGGEDCWLWTEYATITGDLTGLPKFNVPATPTPIPTNTPTPAGPVFTINFKNLHTCSGLQYATVSVKNTGSEVFESAEIHVEDIDASSTLYGPLTNGVPFVANSGGCPPGASTLDPGDNAYVAVSIGAAPPSGHEAKYRLTLCTENGLGGDCTTRSTTFTIP